MEENAPLKEEKMPPQQPPPKKTLKKQPAKQKATVDKESAPIGKEISSGIRNLFDTITQRVSHEIKEVSLRADKDFKRLAASLFFFMLGTVFISIGLVRLIELFVGVPAAYIIVGVLLLFVSITIRRNPQAVK
jgi:hypothetical protein